MKNSHHENGRPHILRRLTLFHPILPGATLRERFLACVAALAAIALTGMFCGFLFGKGPYLPLIVAPMGASAVLLFAVPNSPLAQPWPLIGGNTISALVGVLVAALFHDPIIASGVGVALAIGTMSLTRTLHPPGGAAALTAVLGGPAVTAWGYWFPLVPVALNSIILVLLGIVFHRIFGRHYPHVGHPATNPHLTSDPPAPQRLAFREEDVDIALATINEAFDVDRSDLTRLLDEIERAAAIRSHREVLCADIMSRDVIRIRDTADCQTARALLLKHNIRVLPVEDDKGYLVGTVGLREVGTASNQVGNHVSRAITVAPDEPAVGLLAKLANGHSHAAIVTDRDDRVLGLISQTDLLGLSQKLLARCA